MARKNRAENLANVESISIKPDNVWLTELQNDQVFVDVEIKPLTNLTGLPVVKGFSKAIVSEGKIVNVVSPSYGLLDNRKFFYEVEAKLIAADIKYVTRSINRDNSSFAVDYILSDDRYRVNVKSGADNIRPMLRFTNTYGGGPATGNFGFFREVCSNGLHVANTKIGFRARHKSDVTEVSLLKIGETVEQFISNEYYELRKKFEVLVEAPLKDLKDFVRYTATKLDLFRYEASEKNPDTPSANAKIVMDTIIREAGIIGVQPNLWLGYNAFNEFIHSGKKPFAKQRKMDGDLLGTVLEMAN